jgi:hypothetical protein
MPRKNLLVQAKNAAASFGREYALALKSDRADKLLIRPAQLRL